MHWHLLLLLAYQHPHLTIQPFATSIVLFQPQHRSQDLSESRQILTLFIITKSTNLFLNTSRLHDNRDDNHQRDDGRPPPYNCRARPTRGLRDDERGSQRVCSALCPLSKLERVVENPACIFIFFYHFHSLMERIYLCFYLFY
jgi:hypothetical protein